jgi:hypothetical protein
MNVGNTRRHAARLKPDSVPGCPRCGGFMAAQDLRDFQVDSMWYVAQRCVNCGCIWDPVIGRHQGMSKACGRIRLKKSRPPRPFPQHATLHGALANPPAGQTRVPLAAK